jgi:hypothetical protein
MKIDKYQSPMIKDLDTLIKDLCGILFSKSIGVPTVYSILIRLYIWIGNHKLLFYYNVVPLLNWDKTLTLSSKSLCKNIYMLKLIRKSLLDNGLVFSGATPIKAKYYKKFNP